MRAEAPRPGACTPHARAFTLTEVLLVVAVLALLALLLLPAVTRPRHSSGRLGCTNNLKQIGLAFRTWAIDNDGRLPMQVSVTNGGTMELAASGLVFPHFLVASNELATPRLLVCPNDERRSSVVSFIAGLSDTNISYFVNIDATPEEASSLLCADRNLTNVQTAGSRFVIISNGTRIGWTKEIHSKRGNACFADGAVHGATNGWPLTIVRLPDGVTNRLAIP
jgi:prepilin-type N-terminal cleavage/methylation domain-containing protein/prepilin-type processing-associated H-X9-DG protein